MSNPISTTTPATGGLARLHSGLRWLARGRTLVIGLPYGWLLVFFLTPFLIVLNYSVSEMGVVRPENIATWGDGVVKLSIRFGNYLAIFADDLYFKAYVSASNTRPSRRRFVSCWATRLPTSWRVPSPPCNRRC